MKKEIQEYMRKMGARGGRASARALSSEERTARARKAGKARQAKRRGEQK